MRGDTEGEVTKECVGAKSIYFVTRDKLTKIILKKNQKKAYSLAELSIVVTIVAILISGGLSVLTSSANNVKIQLTKDRMAEIYKAMGAYLINHGSLPCPAPINAIKSSTSVTTYGDATGADGSCTATGVSTRGATAIVSGMLPVQDLGLPAVYAEDGFGSKFTYFVSTAATSTSTTAGFGSAVTTGIITVNDNIAGVTQPATTDAVFVLMSHGVNKFKAYDANSATQNGVSTDTDEQINYGATNAFTASATTSDVFDDMLFFKTRNDIVTDFDALGSVFCQASSADTTLAQDGGASHVWPLSYYNQVSPSTTACNTGYLIRNQFPLRRCGPLGVWESEIVAKCYNS